MSCAEWPSSPRSRGFGFTAADVWPHRPGPDWSLDAGALEALGGLATLTAVLVGHPLIKRLGALWRAWRERSRLFRIELATTRILAEILPVGEPSLREQLREVKQRQALQYARQAMIADQMAAIMWQADKDGQQIWPSQSMIDATGFSAEELKGWGWLNTIHPADRERIRKHWIEAVVEQREFIEDCRCVSRHSDLVIDTHLHAKPFRLSGELICFNGMAIRKGAPHPD